MARWLILLLTVVGACWSAACPEDCSCYHEQGMFKAVCPLLPQTGGKIEVLQVLPYDTSSVTLIDGQFNAAQHLKYLNLSNNSVFYIQKKAFYGAGSLIEIDLSYNFIEELEPSVFQLLTKLTTLSLRGNPLQIVAEVPFLISKTIQNLDIGNCKLNSIPRGIFYGLRSLKNLSLDGNFLKTLKYNSLPKGLKYINLAQNHIVDVPTEVFISLTNLRRIALSGNPINCTCLLLNFQDWFSGRGNIFEGNITCASGINWSKVDENKLCLMEARRDEMSHANMYGKSLRNKLNNKGHYFKNEKSVSDENVQSDQPQSLPPDSQVETIFKNKNTLAMGEMMRDEESKINNGDTNQEVLASPGRKEQPPATEVPENIGAQEINFKKHSEGKVSNLALKNTEEIPSFDELKTQESNNDDTVESTILFHEGEDSINKTHEGLSDSSTSTILDTGTNLSSDNTKNSSTSLIETKNELGDLNKTVEFKSFGESSSEPDGLIGEGLIIPSKEHFSVAKVSLEDSTILPDTEDTTDDEELTTEEPLVVDSDEDGDYNNTNIPTSTSESDTSVFENITSTTEETLEPTTPDTTPEILRTEVYENVSAAIISKTGIPKEPSDVKLSGDIKVSGRQDPNGSKYKSEMAGAEVVMFCVAVLVVCLVLYAIYKCRSPKNHQNKNLNGLESNGCTEMQDMASLLPKSQGNEKKNNLKYTDKAAVASEIVKLIPEQTETESQDFTVVADPKTKLQENNSINNNSSNPITKTPSLKPKSSLNVNQPEPIQRAKARVGIIPDSIPKTPIFLQKTYNNGTNKV